MTDTPNAPAAPAGWYRDPLGIPQLRWWNGSAWTNHIQEPRVEFQSWDDDAGGAEPAQAAVPSLFRTYTVA